MNNIIEFPGAVDLAPLANKPAEPEVDPLEFTEQEIEMFQQIVGFVRVSTEPDFVASADFPYRLAATRAILDGNLPVVTVVAERVVDDEGNTLPDGEMDIRPMMMILPESFIASGRLVPA